MIHTRVDNVNNKCSWWARPWLTCSPRMAGAWLMCAAESNTEAKCFHLLPSLSIITPWKYQDIGAFCCPCFLSVMVHLHSSTQGTAGGPQSTSRASGVWRVQHSLHIFILNEILDLYATVSPMDSVNRWLMLFKSYFRCFYTGKRAL